MYINQLTIGYTITLQLVYNLNYNLYHKWIYNLQNKWFTIGARHGVFIVRVYAHVREFLASIKCVYDNDFHLSFYFICSTIFDIVLSHFVEFCRILSKDMYTAYNIHLLCSLHTIYIPFVYCIHYYYLIKMYTIFFPYSLDKVH